MELPKEEYRRNADLMRYDPIRLIRAVVPNMKKAKWGRIINISSMFGKQPGGLLDYDSIKAAMIMVSGLFRLSSQRQYSCQRRVPRPYPNCTGNIGDLSCIK